LRRVVCVSAAITLWGKASPFTTSSEMSGVFIGSTPPRPRPAWQRPAPGAAPLCAPARPGRHGGAAARCEVSARFGCQVWRTGSAAARRPPRSLKQVG
jgi:hypothetical protein